MKIKTRSYDQITLVDKNIFGLFIGVVFIFVGCIIGYRTISNGANSKELILAIVFAVLGFVATFFSKNIYTNINKTSGEITIKRKSVYKNNKSVYSIRDVAQIQLRQTLSNSNSSSRVGSIHVGQPQTLLINEIVLLLKDGTSTPLNTPTGGKQTILGTRINPIEGKLMSIAIEIATFLGIPYQTVSPNTVVPSPQSIK